MPKTITVRIALAINSAGQWYAYGAQADLDWLVDHQDRLIKKLEAQVANKSGTYALKAADIRQIATGMREIGNGEAYYGLRRLEDLMEEIEPRWREWA